MGFTVTNGDSEQVGGGIQGNSCLAEISRCRILYNCSDQNGGGIHGCNGTIEACIIEHNYSESVGGALSECHGKIDNCLIVHNNAELDGSAINNCDGDIQNCTVMGHYNYECSVLSFCDGEIVNCIIWSNTGTELYHCSLPSYSCFQTAQNINGNTNSNPQILALRNYYYYLSMTALDLLKNFVEVSR